MLRNHQKSNEIERKQQLKPIKTDRSFPNPSKHKACLEKDPNPAKVRSIKTKKKEAMFKNQKCKNSKLKNSTFKNSKNQKLKKSKIKQNLKTQKLKNAKTQKLKKLKNTKT